MSPTGEQNAWGFTDEAIPESPHVCLIYNSEAERRRVVSAFLNAGLERGEAVRYLVDEGTVEEGLDWLRGIGVEVPKQRGSNDLRVLQSDVLEVHPHDAEARGLQEGDWAVVRSRAGETALRVTVTRKVDPGVVYTTFHFPESGANRLTTESSDWATNCPEYKVTAVEVERAQAPGAEGRRDAKGGFDAQGPRLLQMANQVAAFFEALPDQAQAAKEVASHLRRFWSQRMREDFLAAARSTGAVEALKPVVREALAQLAV